LLGAERNGVPEPKWEQSDFRPLLALGSALGLLMGLFVIALFLYAYGKREVPPISHRDLTPAPAMSPLGEAEFEAGIDRERLNKAARKRLDSYGWVDRERGIAHIPLRRAEEIASQEEKP
jgi:hypothetical protein